MSSWPRKIVRPAIVLGSLGSDCRPKVANAASRMSWSMRPAYLAATVPSILHSLPARWIAIAAGRPARLREALKFAPAWNRS
jgi:hypothetical protein